MNTPTTNTPWPRLGVVGVVLAAVIGAILVAFLWPAATAEPRGLPIALAAPQAMADQLRAGMEAQAPDRFDFTDTADRDTATELIETRAAYGAIVLGQEPEVLVSSAANAAVAAQLSSLAPTLQAQLNAELAAAGQEPPAPIVVAVTDVVPLAASDANGVILSASAFPLVLGGVVGGIAISLGIVGIWRRLTALLVFSVVGGLTITGILQGWFGGLQGDYLANSSAIALALLAIGGFVVGLAALLGRPGIALGVVLFVLFANPISSAAIPVEFMVRPWGEIGQWFPPGAAGTLLRDLSYFPKADSLFVWLVLAGWALAGLLLIAITHGRDRSVSLESH